jgi:hypothetical protein
MTRWRMSMNCFSGRAIAAAFAVAALALQWGCTPEIGDKCVLSTDCSLRGDRTCDTSQPGGYCTIQDCRANTCPDDAACVLFNPVVPGCGFNSRTPSRVGRAYCMAYCQDDTDCRDGYVCADPKASPWFGVILDEDIGKRVCIIPGTVPVAEDAGVSTEPLPVCSPFVLDAGTLDAHTIFDASREIDATLTDAGDAASDAAIDSADASGAPDAADAGPTDASDAG